MVFKEPGNAQKKTPQKQQYLEHQKEQPGRGQGQKPQEESPRELKHLQNTKGPPEQADTERKPADGCKGRKRTYSILEENKISPEKKKHRRLLPHHQCEDHGRSKPHRPDLPGTPAQIILNSGIRDSLLPNKMPVLAEKKKPLRNQEKGTEVDQILDIKEDMEKA